MNSAIICDTQFQIINSLNYVYHYNKEMKYDIYIGKEFPNADEVISNIKKTHLFQNVYDYKYDKYSDKKFKHMVNRVKELLLPNKCIQKMLNTQVDFRKKKYHSIYISAPGHFMTLMIWANPTSDVIYFDDGTGSYSGNMLDRLIDNKHRMIYLLLGRSYKKLIPKTLYVNNSKFCKSLLTSDIRQLPSINEDIRFIDLCKMIFRLENDSLYSTYRCVYLGQPYFYKIEKSMQVEEKIQKIITANLTCIARLHPGQSYSEISGFLMDTQRTAWELICVNDIQDNTILIGRCSTAQLTPKIIFDKEPFLIFTYKLLGTLLSEKDIARFEELTKSLEKIYNDKTKIIKPSSYAELEESILFCTKNGDNHVIN